MDFPWPWREGGKKIHGLDILHWRNSTVKLFLFAFVSLYFFQTPNCSPLNAIAHCFMAGFYFARKPPWCSTLFRYVFKSTKILCMLSLLQCSHLFMAAQEEMAPEGDRCLSLSCFSYCCGQLPFILPWSNSSSVRMSFIYSDEVPTGVGTQNVKLVLSWVAFQGWLGPLAQCYSLKYFQSVYIKCKYKMRQEKY